MLVMSRSKPAPYGQLSRKREPLNSPSCGAASLEPSTDGVTNRYALRLSDAVIDEIKWTIRTLESM